MSVTTGSSCPASTDFSNPAYDVAAGGPVGPDGLCPTARYDHVPMSAAQFASLVAAHPPAVSDSSLPHAFKDALASGQTAPGTISTTGPASQVGSPTQSTTTDGTGTTTTTTTPTYNYNYGGDTINYTTTVTTTVNNGGTTTTTTTTPGAPAPQDPNDPCTANPTRAGCQDLGTAPTDAVPKSSKLLTFADEDPGLPSDCPAPVTFSMLGIQRQISWQPICDAAIAAHPWVLAGGALGALLMVVAALRGL